MSARRLLGVAARWLLSLAMLVIGTLPLEAEAALKRYTAVCDVPEGFDVVYAAVGQKDVSGCSQWVPPGEYEACVRGYFDCYMAPQGSPDLWANPSTYFIASGVSTEQTCSPGKTAAQCALELNVDAVGESIFYLGLVLVALVGVFLGYYMTGPKRKSLIEVAS